MACVDAAKRVAEGMEVLSDPRTNKRSDPIPSYV